MPATVVRFQPVAMGQRDPADRFGLLLDVICKESAPGIAPLSTDQLCAAAQLADEAWREYCESGGDVETTMNWLRRRLAGGQGSS